MACQQAVGRGEAVPLHPEAIAFAAHHGFAIRRQDPRSPHALRAHVGAITQVGGNVGDAASGDATLSTGAYHFRRPGT